MNRTERRKIDRTQSKKRQIKNPRVPHLENMNNVMKELGGGFVFDSERISQDNRLYQLYNLPNDGVMKGIIKHNIKTFEEELPQLELGKIEDIVKLDLYMTYFEGLHKTGFFIDLYECMTKVVEIIRS